MTIRACEYFWDTSREVADRLADRVRLVVPFEPDSNLICLALNPVGNDAVAAANRFGRALFSRMKVDPERPVQAKTFIGSYTSLRKENLPGRQADRILDELGLDPESYRSVPDDPAREADHLFILRHTLMNPWLLSDGGGGNYIDRYWSYLEELVDEVLQEDEW